MTNAMEGMDNLLGRRLLSAVILISGALGIVALDAWGPNGGCAGIWITTFGAVFLLGSARECAMLLAHRYSDSQLVRPCLLATTAVMMAAVIPLLWPLTGEPYPDDCPLGRFGWPLVATVLAQLAAFVWFMPSYSPGQQTLEKVFAVGATAAIFGGALAFGVAVRSLGPGNFGLFLVIGLIVITKSADSGAYFVGRAVGRTKLCPRLSPNKTVAGLVAALITAAAVGVLYFVLAAGFFFPSLQAVVWKAVVFSVAIAGAGVLGDLLESMVKREAGEKDSSEAIPGLGGLWDVTDSIIPSFVVAYLGVLLELIPAKV